MGKWKGVNCDISLEGGGDFIVFVGVNVMGVGFVGII